MSTSRESIIQSLSREIVIECNRAGDVLWIDERAAHRFGGARPKKLTDLALPGTEAKVEHLMNAVREGSSQPYEVSLVLAAGPATICFRGRQTDDGYLFVGQLVSARETEAFERVTLAMSELGELHRETARQRVQIGESSTKLEQAHSELLDSNRALLTMHAVLDDKNDALRRASDVKSRVVANVSHEFRTPINSILGITQLLLDRLDGELTSEQEKQLRFVRTSAESLSDLVNDLLDLSRIEAGRHELRVSNVDAKELLSSLRGMMKPLVREDVELVVDEPESMTLETDAGKISQILRNLVANAIKFTEKGSIQVRAFATSERNVRFEVADTGIGIAPRDHDRIFDEFTMIDSPVQQRVRGTGLGLALSRRLAEMLGGSLTVKSRLGEGSTFILEVPRVHEEVTAVDQIRERGAAIDASKMQVLVVEDNRQTLFFYERYLSAAGFQVVPARTVEEARRALERVRPAAIVLDVLLEGESTWGFLSELKEGESTRDIPVMVVTVIDRAQKARALGADEFWLKPVDGDRLTRKLTELAKRGPVGRLLVIDDDEAARYLIRKLLQGTPYTVLEAADGPAGVKIARTQRPDVIFLDFLLVNETAFDVIDDLKADPSTRSIPIIIQTAKTLDEVERLRLERETAAILAKQSLSREIAITRIREALEAAGISARTA